MTRLARLCSALTLYALAAVALLPLVWLACASVRREEDLVRHLFLPPLDRLTLDNYRALFTREPFATWLVNSVFLASTQTALSVTLASLGGFALAKYAFAGKRLLTVVMVATMLVPAQLLLPSGFELMMTLGWVDSYQAILLPGAVGAFGLLLFERACRGVPDELLDAARVDGCSELRLWWSVALPVVRPMVGAYTLMAFLGSWNAFLWPQVILQDERKHTLPIGLAAMVASPEYQSSYGVLMAGTLVAVLPVVALFFALQRDFIAGLTSGAVKG